jgi:hypothetical protein
MSRRQLLRRAAAVRERRGQEQRRLEHGFKVRLALLNAGVVLVAAFLGVYGASYSAIRGADRQVQAQATLNQENFRQNQRQLAYTGVLGAQDALSKFEYSLVTTRYLRGDGQRNALRDHARGLFVRMASANQRLSLVTTPTFASAGQKLAVWHQKYVVALLRVLQKRVGPQFKHTVPPFSKRIFGISYRLSQASHAFLLAAKSDVDPGT